MKRIILIFVLLVICNFVFAEVDFCGKITDIILITFDKSYNCYIIIKIEVDKEILTICGRLTNNNGYVIKTGQKACIEKTLFGSSIVIK